MPTAVGRWRGLSSLASTRVSTVWRRPFLRPRTLASLAWSRRKFWLRVAARYGYSSRANCLPSGIQQPIRALEAGGEGAAGALVAKLGAKSEIGRELAYRLYTICERKKRAAEALAYNGLVQSWPEIVRLGQVGAAATPMQESLL